MVEAKYSISAVGAKQKIIDEMNVILSTFSFETLEALHAELCAKCPRRSLDTLLRLRDFGSTVVV